MTSTVIRPTETLEGDCLPSRGRAESLSLGGTRSGIRASLDYRRRPPDQRALCAPGGWGTRPEHSPMSVFGAVRALDVRSLAGPVADVEVTPGTELVREGEPIGTFFVIRRGRALLARAGCGIETLGGGDCFGQ